MQKTKHTWHRQQQVEDKDNDDGDNIVIAIDSTGIKVAKRPMANMR